MSIIPEQVCTTCGACFARQVEARSTLSSRWAPEDTARAASIAQAMGFEVEDADETDEANIRVLAQALAALRLEIIQACALAVRKDADVVHDEGRKHEATFMHRSARLIEAMQRGGEAGKP